MRKEKTNFKGPLLFDVNVSVIVNFDDENYTEKISCVFHLNKTHIYYKRVR